MELKWEYKELAHDDGVEARPDQFFDRLLKPQLLMSHISLNFG